MEELILRYPGISVIIFDLLDDLSLGYCRLVCKTWKFFIDEEKFFWLRIIHKYGNICCYFPNYPNNFKMFTKAPLNIVKEMALSFIEFGKFLR